MPNYDLICENGHEQRDILLRVGERPPCPECGETTSTLWSGGNVISDEIPGGVLIHNGLCDPLTGAPVRYYSKSAIEREAKRRGLVNNPGGKGDYVPKKVLYFT